MLTSSTVICILTDPTRPIPKSAICLFVHKSGSPCSAQPRRISQQQRAPGVCLQCCPLAAHDPTHHGHGAPHRCTDLSPKTLNPALPCQEHVPARLPRFMPELLAFFWLLRTHPYKGPFPPPRHISSLLTRAPPLLLQAVGPASCLETWLHRSQRECLHVQACAVCPATHSPCLASKPAPAVLHRQPVCAMAVSSAPKLASSSLVSPG